MSDKPLSLEALLRLEAVLKAQLERERRYTEARDIERALAEVQAAIREWLR